MTKNLKNVFGGDSTEDLGDIFSTADNSNAVPTSVDDDADLFNLEEDDEESSKGMFEDDDEDLNIFNVEEDDDDDDDESDDDDVRTTPKKSSGKAGQNKQLLESIVSLDPDFMVYDDHENRTDYSIEEVTDIFVQNSSVRAENMAKTALISVIEGLSPAVQKVVTAELQGIKLKDVLKEADILADIENIPSNPTEEDKERIVRRYYTKIAEAKNKDVRWVSSKIKLALEKDIIDDEFEEAKEYFEEEFDKITAAKAKELEEKEERSRKFKETHTKFVKETLSQEDLFGIKLTPSEKKVVGDVLAGFVVRDRDKKEKLALTALIDDMINHQNPKESYQRLALMALMAVKPKELITKLKGVGVTETTQKNFIKMKTPGSAEFKKPKLEKPKNKESRRSVFG